MTQRERQRHRQEKQTPYGEPDMGLFFFFLRFLFIHERHTERHRHRQREKQAPHREPNVRPSPRQGSYPEPKADAQPLSHPGAPGDDSFNALTKITVIT